MINCGLTFLFNLFNKTLNYYNLLRKEVFMEKKHFICTHTWINEDAKKQGTEFTSGMTEKEFFDSVKSDKAETLAHWMGKEDFFFCHWYAESADDIMDVLDKGGFHELMITMPSEMQRFVTTDNIQDKKLVNPDD